jgi:hypothetical protein
MFITVTDCPVQGDQKMGGKFAQILDKVAKTVAKQKKMPKHLLGG